jgi:hypothetical protein
VKKLLNIDKPIGDSFVKYFFKQLFKGVQDEFSNKKYFFVTKAFSAS